MQYQYTSEIAIIGSGPAGCAASFFLSKDKVPHLIFDKDVFPRDKVCGDGLSPKVIHVMRKFDASILEQMAADTAHFAPSYGGYAVSPNGNELTILISKIRGTASNIAPGYITRRYDFDYFLTKQINPDFASVLHGAKVISLKRLNGGVEIEYQKDGQTYFAFAKTLIAADGDRSIVKKTFAPSKMQPKHYCAGIRAYYKNVKGMDTNKNLLEFHFINTILPGYFWIFPLPDGSANVGVGMISHDVSKNKVNLKEVMLHAIQNEPHLKERFADAVLEDKIVGWGLPLGSKLGTLSGENFMLTGDAGSFIDPISGEGIGNAFYTGMLAAQAIIKAKDENQPCNADFLIKNYDKRVARTMGMELRLSAFFQKIAHYPSLLNFIIRRASRNKVFMESAEAIFNDEFYKKLFNPIFIFRIAIGFFR